MSERLGKFMAERKTLILNQWIKAVHQAPGVTSANQLDPEEVKDHFDLLLEYFIETVRANGDEELKLQIRQTASNHGLCRWNERYRPGEILLEISLLRGLLIELLFAFFERHLDIGTPICVEEAKNLHQLLDDTMQCSVEEYFRVQHTGVG